MDSRIVARYGDSIDLGGCLVGKNLNLLVLRGFAPLDVLAEISAPDVYDMVVNRTGTQRALKRRHAEECYDYAIGALAVTADEEPRAFPEIILNVRDVNVVECFNVDDPGELFDITSFSEESEIESPYVGVRILSGSLEFPMEEKSPQISRVDGNHRLHETDRVLDDWWDSGSDDQLDQDFPVVPFTMTLGLAVLQEARLFRDINGEHEGMETAHLDALRYRITENDQLKSDPRHRPLWIAHKLTEPGKAFEGMVFFGGAQAGVRAQGQVPPIKINALKSAIKQQLAAAPVTNETLKDNPDQLVHLLDRFWKGVRECFPEAWQNRKDYILLQSIGLGGFAKFGGTVLDRAMDSGKIEYEEIKHHLEPVAAAVSLDRAEYRGIAGAGGAQVIAAKLLAAADSNVVKKQEILAKLTEGEDGQTALD